MKKLLALVVAALTMFDATTVRAAGTLESGAEELLFSEIPVVVEVASLFKESALQAGASVELVTEKDWSTRGDRNIFEAISHQPSVKAVKNYNSTSVFIRGYSTNPGSRGTAIILDGIPLNGYSFQTALYGTTNFDLGLLDRIEMIRGPGSALYGSDAFHGVIALKTVDPTENMMSIKSSYGKFNYSDNSLLFSRNVGSWRVTGGAAYQNTGDQGIPYRGVGYTNPNPVSFPTQLGSISGHTSGADFNHAGMFKVKSDPEKGVVFDAAYYNNADRDECEPYSIMYGRKPCMAPSNERDAGRAGFTFKLPGQMTLETMGYYWNSEYEWYNPEGYIGEIVGISGLLVGPFITKIRVRDRRWGSKVILKQPDFLNTQWVLGYEYSHMDTPNGRMYQFSPTTGQLVRIRRLWDRNNLTLDPFSVLAPYTLHRREVESAFLTAKTGVWDKKLSFLYGGRYDLYTDIGGHFSPRMGAIYQPTDRSAVKLIYGNAFRAPSVGEQYGQNFNRLAGRRDLTPEILKSYELTYMYDGDKWKSELTAFTSRWDNVEAIIGISPTVAQYGNLGTLVSHGLEGKTDVHMGDFDFNLNGSYNRAHDLNTGVAGNAFPRWIINGGVSHNMPEHQLKTTVTNRLTLEGDKYNTGGNGLKDYFRTDLNVTKGLSEHWTVAVDVQNIFDRSNEMPHNLGESMNISGITERGVQYWFTVNWFMGTKGVLWNQ